MGIKINQLDEKLTISDGDYTIVDNGVNTSKYKLTNISDKASADLATHTSDTVSHIASTERTNWNGKYKKPSAGIPKTDLASAVQQSLNKTLTAVQTITSSDNSLTVTKSDTTYDLKAVIPTVDVSKAYVDTQDTTTLNSAKSYADTKKSEAINSSTSTLNTRLNSKTISCLTLAQYNALTTKNANTLYFCTES